MDKYKDLHEQSQAERRKRRMCVEKTAYKTKEEAFQKGQNVYPCPHCHKWHRSGKVATFVAEVLKQNRINENKKDTNNKKKRPIKPGGPNRRSWNSFLKSLNRRKK